MAATGRTKNYDLPIFTATDGTTWEAYNRAMNLIDTALANLEGSQGGDVTQEDLDELKVQLDMTISVLVNKDTKLQTQITNLGTTVDGHTEDITTLKADVAEVQTDVSKAQADIAAGDSKDVDLQEQITAQEHVVLENHAKVGELQTQIDNLGTTVDGHTGSIKEIQSTFDDYVQHEDARITAIEQKDEELQTQIDNLGTTVDGHTTEIGNLKTAIDQIEGAGEVTELAATVAGHTTQIAAIDTQVKKNTGEIAVLDSQMSVANREISLQSGSIGSLNTSVMTLSETAKNLETNVQTLSGRIDDANDYMNDVLAPDVDNVKKEVQALNGNLNDVQSEITGWSNIKGNGKAAIVVYDNAFNITSAKLESTNLTISANTICQSKYNGNILSDGRIARISGTSGLAILQKYKVDEAITLSPGSHTITLTFSVNLSSFYQFFPMACSLIIQDTFIPAVCVVLTNTMAMIEFSLNSELQVTGGNKLVTIEIR